MDADSQARGGRVGRSGGVPNYKNDILIDVVELYLPRGLEAWREVALAYQRESMETVLRRGEDLRDNWNKKLCNRMQKPTGKPGVNTDRIFRCIEIERRIQDEAAAAILGADSAESAHSRDNGESALLDVAPEDDFEIGGDEEDEDWEGCLSVPGVRGKVPRWSRIRYTGFDPYGDPIDRTVEGFHARVVQHECDHLIGKLYPMRVRDFTQFGFTEVLFPDISANEDD